MFPSETEPWDGCLSGTPGMSPGYDALAFAIEECHKRGIKLHAWVVALPVGNWNATGCRMLRKTVPHLLKKIGNEGF
ncbi:family 10 glycosylhydrolase, partial [Klebsiella pneumoniae]|uniref:family 10 glycosylhydrolase n=1 Tax=Klebsiella pneumoniae TaxID=573 RepID=UPI003A858534